MRDKTIQIIKQCAEVPSFSTYEERLHPLIARFVNECRDVKITSVSDKNLFIQVPGNRDISPVALTAHLDKINHFGVNPPEKLPFYQSDTFIEGQLDDTVGLGLCLRMMQIASKHTFPPLYLLFSEMEESYGLRNHPHLLRNEGKNIHHGMGAERLSEFLLNNKLLPSLIITIDTTPLFKGTNGLALYSKHWEMNKVEPSSNLVARTEEVVRQIRQIFPGIYLSNNTNDYLTYGKMFNKMVEKSIPSIAIEPAIFPYHQKRERVFKEDIEETEILLTTFLEHYEG